MFGKNHHFQCPQWVPSGSLNSINNVLFQAFFRWIIKTAKLIFWPQNPDELGDIFQPWLVSAVFLCILPQQPPPRRWSSLYVPREANSGSKKVSKSLATACKLKCCECTVITEEDEHLINTKLFPSEFQQLDSGWYFSKWIKLKP